MKPNNVFYALKFEALHDIKEILAVAVAVAVAIAVAVAVAVAVLSSNVLLEFQKNYQKYPKNRSAQYQ